MNKIRTLTIYVFYFLLVFSQAGLASEQGAERAGADEGEVRIPLGEYTTMLEQARNQPDTAPAAYAIGASSVSVLISDVLEKSTANVRVKASIEIFEDKWVSIPILPYGAAITRAEIDGEAIQLVQKAEWLSWTTSEADVVELELSYSIDAFRSKQGYTLPLPIPRAASTAIELTYPGSEVDLSIVPASNLNKNTRTANSIITADVPTSSFVQIAWRIPEKEDYVISRASYEGRLQNNAMRLQASFDLELFNSEKIKLPLISKQVTLNSMKVDGKEAVILAEDENFSVLVNGRGKHQITAVFEAALDEKDGPSGVSFPIPNVPISRFDIELPGNKTLQVNSKTNLKTNVSTVVKNDLTRATVFLPLSDIVNFSWADALPVDVQTSFRANANIYHAIYAEEGVLHGRALIDYDVTQGESSSLSFSLPANAQVNRIESAMAGIADWSEKENPQKPANKDVTVFFDRAIKDQYQLTIFYERLLSHSEDPQAKEHIVVPLIKAENMHRQRGVVALLTGTELSLSPLEEKQVTRVGENQLPAFFKNQIKQPIVHTYKYTSDNPYIQVKTEAPERQQGKYDAQVDTLASLGEVTLRGSATIQLDVKSGSLIDLDLQLSKNINVLNVSGPSLRNYKVSSDENKQNIAIEFTQEMLGQFRLEVSYEKILGDSVSQLEVSTIDVVGAEVQHGRIAVEALTAVEVQAGLTEQLSTLEVVDLPRQLVLKTTNPILLAFKYVKTDLPQRLVLDITRHQELRVQEAAIENANYQTLITMDGLAVTTARFEVQNSGRQFLRLDLPRGSEVWSVFVDGNAEKPAKVDEQENKDRKQYSSILIKMLNSESGFPVEVVYASRLDKMGNFGRISAQLPVPDMVVTNSYWNVYLPLGLSYQSLNSNMLVTTKGIVVNPHEEVVHSSISAVNRDQALRLKVPARGVLFSFEKLYANQGGSLAQFTVKYSSSLGNQSGLLMSALAVFLIWLGIFVLRAPATKYSNQIIGASMICGTLLLIISVGYMNIDSSFALGMAIFGGVAYLAYIAYDRFRQRPQAVDKA